MRLTVRFLQPNKLTMNTAVILSIIKYSYDAKISLDDAIEELHFTTSVNQLKPLKLKILTLNRLQAVLSSANWRLLQELSSSILKNCRQLHRKLRAMAPIVVKMIVTREEMWNKVISYCLLCIDNIFLNELDTVNELRLIRWYLKFIKTVVNKVTSRAVGKKFVPLLIQSIIQKVYNLVLQNICAEPVTRIEVKVVGHYHINQNKVLLLLLLHIKVLLYVQEEMTEEDHLNMLSILLMTKNDELIRYYQAENRFKP